MLQNGETRVLGKSSDMLPSREMVIDKSLKMSHPTNGQNPKQGNKWEKVEFTLYALLKLATKFILDC